MHKNFIQELAPKFYGSTTVGERGQVVIPAEARKDYHIIPTTKLLVFGSHEGGGLILTKADSITEFLSRAMNMLTRFEEMLKAEEDKSE